MLWKPKSHTLAPKIRSIAPSSNTDTVLSGPFINEYKPQLDKKEKKCKIMKYLFSFEKKVFPKTWKPLITK